MGLFPFFVFRSITCNTSGMIHDSGGTYVRVNLVVWSRHLIDNTSGKGDTLWFHGILISTDSNHLLCSEPGSLD